MCHPRYWGIPLSILFLPPVKFECIPRESCAGNLFPNVLKVVSAEKCVGYQCPKSLHEPIPWSHMWDYYPNSLRLSQECALALLQKGSVQSLSPAPGAMLSGFPASRIFFYKASLQITLSPTHRSMLLSTLVREVSLGSGQQ